MIKTIKEEILWLSNKLSRKDNKEKIEELNEIVNKKLDKKEKFELFQ